MVFLCANTCVVHAPAAIVAQERSHVLLLLEEVVDFGKLSTVQFVPRGLIRLTFKDTADKDRLVNQGSVMLDNIECSVTPSDRPITLVYDVYHYPAEGDDALLCEEFRRYGKIVSVKHQHFSGRPNLLTESRILTMSLSKTIPAEVFVDAYPTRVWYSGMQPFCQICKTRGHKAADCEYNGKCRECGAADHLARACPSRRGGRVWGTDSVPAGAAPPVDAESFPPIVASPVVAEVEVTPGPSGVLPVDTGNVDHSETVLAVNSMDVSDVLNVIAENSHVTTVAPPIVSEVEVTPGLSGVSLLCADDSMDVGVVENVTVENSNVSIENAIVDNNNTSTENVIKTNVSDSVCNR